MIHETNSVAPQCRCRQMVVVTLSHLCTLESAIMAAIVVLDAAMIKRSQNIWRKVLTS